VPRHCASGLVLSGAGSCSCVGVLQNHAVNFVALYSTEAARGDFVALEVQLSLLIPNCCSHVIRAQLWSHSSFQNILIAGIRRCRLSGMTVDVDQPKRCLENEGKCLQFRKLSASLRDDLGG